MAPNTFDCSHVGDNSAILIVTDINGNTTNCNPTVTVEDISNTCCEQIVLVNDNPIMTGTYQAWQEIQSNGFIPMMGTVFFKAHSIRLNNGFESRGVFEARIEPCGQN